MVIPPIYYFTEIKDSNQVPALGDSGESLENSGLPLNKQPF